MKVASLVILEFCELWVTGSCLVVTLQVIQIKKNMCAPKYSRTIGRIREIVNWLESSKQLKSKLLT